MAIDEELLSKERIIGTHKLSERQYQYSTVNGRVDKSVRHYTQWCLDCGAIVSDATINRNLSTLKECAKLPPRLRVISA
jgi:hypothetical protein